MSESEGGAFDAAGWHRRARRVASPNFDARPDGVDVELLVIHNISLPPGRFGGPAIEALFTNRLDPAAHPSFTSIADLRVSAHFLIRRDGRLLQFVAIGARAWHAGVSNWRGRVRCNDFSIGIELEGTDARPYTAQQYRRLAALARDIRRACPSLTGLAGHSEIAPGRKSDPGPAFDWGRFMLDAGLPPTMRAL
jgi:AmpD protein